MSLSLSLNLYHSFQMELNEFLSINWNEIEYGYLN